MNTRLIHSLLCAALVATAAGSAHAHAQLDHANPRVGSAGTAPSMVSLFFTEPVEPAFSSIEVLNAAGARVDAGKARLDPANPSLLQVNVKALAAGLYTVRWRVISVDTHRTEGSFTFEVRP